MAASVNVSLDDIDLSTLRVSRHQHHYIISDLLYYLGNLNILSDHSSASVAYFCVRLHVTCSQLSLQSL